MTRSSNDLRPHYVYRIHAADNDELLYIGCTHDVEVRLGRWRREDGRMRHVSDVLKARGIGRVESQEYPNKAEARQAERDAIKADVPPLNRDHHPTYSGQRGHGYSQYTHGCRCEVCTQAKADYTRSRRRAASERRQARLKVGALVAPLTAHGIAGYQEHGCRCPVCIGANRAAQRRQYKGKTTRAAS